MALTISIEGLGVIANADAETNDTGGDGTGDWGWSGSGGVAWGLTTDVYIYGVSCISAALSGAKAGWLYFDRGSAMNFTTGGQIGEHIYIWVHCPTLGLIDDKAGPGLAIQAGTDTSNYRTWVVAGANDQNGWAGGWRCFVLDPTKPGSIADTGTYEASTVSLIGMYMATTTTAKGDNLFIDQIAVGKGIRATGVSANGWEEIVTYCTDHPNRAWGMMQEREGVYYQYGKVYVGSPVQTAITNFQDSGRVVQYGVSEYWASPSWVSSASRLYSGIEIQDSGSYATIFIDGNAVGSDKGRSGSVFVGNDNHDVSLIISNNATSGSVTYLYGSRFADFTGSLIIFPRPDNGGQRVWSVQFEGCEEVDPRRAELLNTYFINTQSPNAAMKWNDNIDIGYCYFIANTTGAGTHHLNATSVSYNNLIFSGNTYDVLNDTTGSLFISAVDSEVSNATNPQGGDTYISQDVFLTVNVENADGDAVASARVRIDTSLGTNLMNVRANGSGQAQTSFNYYGVTDIDVYVRRSSPGLGQRYIPLKTSGQIDSGGFTLTAVLQADNIA